VIKMIFDFLKELFGATRAVAEAATQRDAENNSPEMKAAANAQISSDAADRISKDLEEGNLEKVQRDEAETLAPPPPRN
jgi:hypothetical protein